MRSRGTDGKIRSLILPLASKSLTISSTSATSRTPYQNRLFPALVKLPSDRSKCQLRFSSSAWAVQKSLRWSFLIALTHYSQPSSTCQRKQFGHNRLRMGNNSENIIQGFITVKGVRGFLQVMENLGDALKASKNFWITVVNDWAANGLYQLCR